MAKGLISVVIFGVVYPNYLGYSRPRMREPVYIRVRPTLASRILEWLYVLIVGGVFLLWAAGMLVVLVPFLLA